MKLCYLTQKSSSLREAQCTTMCYSTFLIVYQQDLQHYTVYVVTWPFHLMLGKMYNVFSLYEISS